MEYDVNLSSFNFDINFVEELFQMGDDVQKISIIQSLPQLLSFDSSGTNNRIIPKIKQDLGNASCEFQIAASGVFKTLLQKSGNTTILQSVIAGIESSDPNVAFAWCEALFGSVVNMPELMIQNNLIPLAKQKFQPNSSVTAKMFSAKLIGEICTYPKFRAIDPKKDILPIATGLCQDVNADVRANICQMLPRVVKALGRDVENTNLLSCIVELAQDDNMNVRATSILALSALLTIVSPEISKNTLLPLIKKICQIAMDESLLTALILSKEYSDLMLGCQPILNDPDVIYFVRVYKQLSLKGKQAASTKATASKEVTVRQRCASNTYGIMKVAYECQPSHMQEVYASFRDHVVDPCYLVRQAAAGVLADLASLLDKDNKIMKNEVVRLLRDDAVEVLEVLVPSISSVFSSLVSSETLKYQEANQATTELCKALIKCQTELTKGYNWRLTVEYLKQLEILPTCIPAEYIHTNFTPSVFEKVINGKAKPVRHQAIHTLIVFMRYNFKPNQVKWIKDSLIRQTALSKDCNNRQLYMYVCAAVLSVYSEKYFKECFLQPLLQLSRDRIIGVRWKFMQFSSTLKSMVTLASDMQTKQSILEAINKIETTEKSKCMIDIIRAKRKEGPPKYSADALKEEECRVRQEATTNIYLGDAPIQQKHPPVAATGDARHVSITRPSDMRFLEQHFYIDAGIKLDVLDLNDSNENVVSDVCYLKNSELELIETTNITDDVKVNLRNLNSLIPPRPANKTKRHSSIMSSQCFENVGRNQAVQKRRSLHLNSSNESKIPIANRTKGTHKSTKEEVIHSSNTTKSTPDLTPARKSYRKSSGLPIYNRNLSRNYASSVSSD